MLSLFTACLLVSAPSFPVPKWEPCFQGVERGAMTATEPRPLKAVALRIDLAAEGVSFLATPGNADRPGETDGLKTSTFLTRNRCQAAINAAPFAGSYTVEDRPMDVVGLHISRGVLVSESSGQYPALLMEKSNKARIAKPPFDAGSTYNAVGGFQIVLKGGTVFETKNELHPRTAVGISANGKTMIWLVIDGRQKGTSEGVTTGEVGRWLKALGAAEGINLDGGGTSTLAIEEHGKAKVLNVPINGGTSGAERVSGSHLGLFAKPLPK